PVVLRAVARALEPLRALAPWHAAPEVHAALVERDEASLHAGEQRGRVDLLDLGHLAGRIRVEIGAGLGDVVRLLGRRDRRGDVAGLAGLDLAAEAGAGRRPEEADHAGGAEAGDAQAHQRDDAAVEELPAGDVER